MRSASHRLLLRQIKGFGGGPVHANHPQGAPEVSRAGSGATHLQPAPILFVCLIGVHENVSVAILRARFAYRNFLMPAVLSANRVRLDRESQILMYARVFPMDTRGIGIAALEGLNAMDLPHHPFSGLDLLQIDQRCRPAFAAKVFFEAPASKVMGARDDAG